MKPNRIFIFTIVLYLVAAVTPLHAQFAEVRLDRIPKIFDLSVIRSSPPRLLLATPNGLLSARPEGMAWQVAAPQGLLMALARHPNDPKVMYMSGHTPEKKDLGVFRSTDGGREWRKVSRGSSNHTGFHLLEFSKANSEVIYAITTRLLHRSQDGGKTWRPLGPLPQKLIGLASSSLDTDTLYAATQGGLLKTTDAGKSWNRAYPGKAVASMVHISSAGRMYAFVLGVGLIARDESKNRWEALSSSFQDQILLRMVVDTVNPKRLYAATLTGAVVTSGDGGRTWGAFEGSHQARPAIIAKGKTLFNTYCQGCHGPDGRGQDPKTLPKGIPDPVLAPPLNDTAHAWHHNDAALATTILDGSPREGSPMIAWKSQLSRPEVESLVAYIKSLWSFRSLACQGARHMSCMQRR